MRRIAVASMLTLALTACTMSNPAFDELDELGEGESGEPTTGDGDPTTTGDGDGDPTTTGGMTTGDGDGDPMPTTGDGDGDPMPTTGDGDGDPMPTTGDGDGDPIGLCDVGVVVEPYEPALLSGAAMLEVADAPGFALQEPDCQVLTICQASQPTCGPDTPFILRVNSGGLPVAGISPANAVAIRLNFSPGKPTCGLPPLIFDQSQAIKIHAVNDENVPTTVSVRLPCFEGTLLDLWVGHDGSSFYDPELFEAAALW